MASAPSVTIDIGHGVAHNPITWIAILSIGVVFGLAGVLNVVGLGTWGRWGTFYSRHRVVLKMGGVVDDYRSGRNNLDCDSGASHSGIELT